MRVPLVGTGGVPLAGAAGVPARILELLKVAGGSSIAVTMVSLAMESCGIRALFVLWISMGMSDISTSGVTIAGGGIFREVGRLGGSGTPLREADGA